MKKLKWLLVLWDKIKWLFVTHLGRFALGIIFLISGMLSDYGSIAFLRTGWVFFEYTAMVGAVIFAGQALYLIFGGLYYWNKQR